MGRVIAAKIDHFSKTIDRSSFILTTVMPQMTFHQPRFGVLGIDFQNTIEKNLRNIPAFFRNRSGCMRTINPNLRIPGPNSWFRISLENAQSYTHIEN